MATPNQTSKTTYAASVEDKVQIQDYTRRIYELRQPRCSTIEGKQLLLTASDQLMKYIKWLEAQSEKL